MPTVLQKPRRLFTAKSACRDGRYGIKVVTISPGLYALTTMTQKNPYHMPFLMDVDVFAKRAPTRSSPACATERFRGNGWITTLLRWMPRWLFDRLMANRKQNPRVSNVPS